MEDDALLDEYPDLEYRESLILHIKEGESFDEDDDGWSNDRYCSSVIGKSVRAVLGGGGMGKARLKLEGRDDGRQALPRLA